MVLIFLKKISSNIKKTKKLLGIALRNILILCFDILDKRKQSRDIKIEKKLKKLQLFEKRWTGWYYFIKCSFYFLIVIFFILIFYSAVNPNFFERQTFQIGEEIWSIKDIINNILRPIRKILGTD